MGGFSKEAGFVITTCQSIFREEKAQNENNDLPNKAASERQEKSEKTNQSQNIFQNRSVYKTAVKLLKFKLCVSMPATIRQEIQKVHFKALSFCLSHPCLSYSLTKWTNHEII